MSTRRKLAQWGKITDRDKAEHAAFLQWFRMNHSPRVTMAVPSRSTGFTTGYTLRANNGARVGFSMRPGGWVEMFYQYPQGRPTLLLLKDGATTAFRKNNLSEEEYNYLRRHQHRLHLHLLYWQQNIPHLMDYLGCRGDLRFIAALTLATNYQIPKTSHETPVDHTRQPDLPSLEF